MPVWAKVDVNLPTNPKVKRARYWASQAYTALLLINKAHAFRGYIPADYGAPEELVDFWRMDREDRATFGEEPVELMRRGLRACVREKLISWNDDAIELVGWGPEWDRNDSSADRQRRYRERKAEKRQAPETPESDVTLRNGVTGDGDRNVTEGVHRGEERIGEESRGEENPLPPNGGAQPTPPESRKAKAKTKRQKLLAKWREEAGELWDHQELLRASAIPRSRPLTPDDERLARVAERLDGKATREDCELVLKAYADESRRRPESAKHFNGVTNWIKKNFDRTLGGLGAAQAPASKAGRAKPMGRDEYSESGKQDIR